MDEEDDYSDYQNEDEEEQEFIYINKENIENHEIFSYRENITIDDITYCSAIPKNMSKNTIYVIKKPGDILKFWNKIDKQYHRYIFFENEMKYNILDHPIMHKHEVITEKDLPKNILISELPIIKTYDPVCRRTNIKEGSIVKIHRKDSSFYYRYVS